MRQSLSKLSGQFQDAADAMHACIRDGDLVRLQALLSDSSHALDLSRAHVEYGPPLHFAAWCGDVDAVDLLLDAGADPLLIATKPYRGQPLYLAVYTGHRDVVKRLWSLTSASRALLHWSDDLKAEALIHAAAYWHHDATAVLLQSSVFDSGTIGAALDAAIDDRAWGGPNPPTPEGFDYHNHQRLVGLLIDALKASADLDGSPFCGAHVLLSAASNANLVGALSTLLAKGAEPDRQDGAGYTALHIVASPVPVGRWSSGRQASNKAAIEMLVRHGASVVVPDNKGDAPLQLAAFGADLPSFKLYLSPLSNSEALLVLTNLNGETLLHYAAAGCNIGIMEHLIAQGLDVNARNTNGWTPLMCALTPTLSSPLTYDKATATTTPAESTRAAQLLLHHGADARIVTDEGWTTLHALALHCDVDALGRIAEMAVQIIGQGVDPEARAPLPTLHSAQHRQGMPWGHRLRKAMMDPSVHRLVLQPSLTPLQWAAQHGAVGVVKALLAAGVDATVVDASGTSVVDMVHASYVQSEVVDVIVALLRDGKGS
ncbi:ankyrin repeat-containing domain protein [Stachybotrys elegans]|uniref:Ankyrin repeat-containing domain protein n=1 Tax=Stachybotrys elegans TaxID=80388 RepID=A0A8K0WJV6_9HYPO|nr:ankyrin repeat-containing domain protein [Stachybotrys elegans]